MTQTARPIEQSVLTRALARVALADREAFAEVYRLTSAKLFGVCLRILSDREEAEDVLQDVFVAIWSKAGQFDAARASPITWASTIARNRAIDRLRSRGVRPAVPLGDIAEPEDGSAGALDQLIEAEGEHGLRVCLQRLGDGDGRLIRAAFLDGNTYAELATRAATPLGTIKSRIRRALLRLRDCLSTETAP